MLRLGEACLKRCVNLPCCAEPLGRCYAVAWKSCHGLEPNVKDPKRITFIMDSPLEYTMAGTDQEV